jgi:hypothetical protein
VAASGTAAASCIDEVHALAERYQLTSKPPKSSSGKGPDVSSNKLAQVSRISTETAGQPRPA